MNYANATKKWFVFVLKGCICISLVVLSASAISESAEGYIYNVEALDLVEKIERQKLNIPNDVKINFIFGNNWGIADSYRKRGALGLTYSNDKTRKYITICLQKPSLTSIARHEIYHAYRLSRSNLQHLQTGKEQFLAYAYGTWQINLEFLFD